MPLQPGNDAQRFAELSSQVRATDVSSHSFNEDAFAGIMQAVDEMDWSPYAGRVVLLVTDAGALRKNDPLGRTQMNEAEVRQAALRKGVKIHALHLRTPAGRITTATPSSSTAASPPTPTRKIADLYIPVAGGEVNAFGNTVKEIGTVFADLVHDAGNRSRRRRASTPRQAWRASRRPSATPCRWNSSVAATRCARRRSSPPGPPTVT